MELVGDVGHVESHFGPMVLLGDKAQVKAILVRLESAILDTR
jgi:hypothetical protein